MSNSYNNMKYDICGNIVIHSMDKNSFEIMDIILPREYDTPEEEGLSEMFCEDVGDLGDISRDIHKELWKQSSKEQTNKIKIYVNYTTIKDFDGEIDVGFEYKYEILDRNIDLDTYLQQMEDIENHDY